VVGCEVLRGVASKSLLKVKVQVQSLPRRITCSIPLHASNSAPLPQLRKSIALRKLHSPKNPPKKKLGEDRIRPSVYSPAQPFAPLLQLRFRSLRKINCTLQNALAEKKSCVVGCEVLRGVGG